MTPRRAFSFDGFGINGPDEYRSRLATFTPAGHDYPGLGPLLEAAPEMRKVLQMFVDALNTPGFPDPLVIFVCIEKARGILENLK